jgi:D-arginine dehydrogenase
VESADFLIIGAGVAGLSAAARLAAHGRVIVLEAEDAPGFHSSGRSVAFSHYGIGNDIVKALTAWSRPRFEPGIARPFPTLYFADQARLPILSAMQADMAAFSNAIRAVEATEIARLCPILNTGPGAAVAGLLDPTGLKLDADALLQSYARPIRAAIRTGVRAESIAHRGGRWTVNEAYQAPVLVNAAGAWADRVALMAGVKPLGLAPKRRTIIALDPPAGADIGAWPFVHAVAGDFYMLPEAGQLLVSPVDEVPDEPGDAQPEEYDLALAADRFEHYTSGRVAHIAHRWAGLRTFTADRTPTAGFAPDAPGFCWLAGQGGYGLQTAPAMAAVTEALVTGAAWPAGLAAVQAQIRPERLFAA